MKAPCNRYFKVDVGCPESRKTLVISVQIPDLSGCKVHKLHFKNKRFIQLSQTEMNKNKNKNTEIKIKKKLSKNSCKKVQQNTNKSNTISKNLKVEIKIESLKIAQVCDLM